jgi:ubiquitin-protein ligase
MPSKSKTPSSQSKDAKNTLKRLTQELKDYQRDPNEALLHLGPASDDDLMEWTAVLKGVDGTAYEGTYVPSQARNAMLSNYANTIYH